MDHFFLIGVLAVNPIFLFLALFEEVQRHLREHSIGEHILLLLAPLSHLLPQGIQLRLQQIRRSKWRLPKNHFS